MTLLSRLLVDEQFRGLIEKYGDEIVTRMAQAASAPNGNVLESRAEPLASENDGGPGDFTNLHARVLAMEAQQEAQQVMFDFLRSKVRPLALALGCCPECFVGMNGCPKCWGQSKVAHYAPDYTLLETQIVNPLAARGVSLVLGKTSASGAGRH